VIKKKQHLGKEALGGTGSRAGWSTGKGLVPKPKEESAQKYMHLGGSTRESATGVRERGRYVEGDERRGTPTFQRKGGTGVRETGARRGKVFLSWVGGSMWSFRSGKGGKAENIDAKGLAK